MLYSFVRKPDNIVDTVGVDYNQAKLQLQWQLEQLRGEYDNLYENDIPKSEEFTWFLNLCKECLFTMDDAEAFYAAMICDCYIHRYNSMAQLNQYMYGSAVIVGLMMNKIMGCNNSLCNYYGGQLADAMQLTNFLRDIREDYRDLGRIYMPSEELRLFGLSHDDIIELCTKKEKNPIVWSLYTKYMKHMIVKCRDAYREAESGYIYLPGYARPAISLAWALYEGILDKIEKNNYDVFTKSARTSLFDKLKIIRLWNINNNKKQ